MGSTPKEPFHRDMMKHRKVIVKQQKERKNGTQPDLRNGEGEYERWITSPIRHCNSKKNSPRVTEC